MAVDNIKFVWENTFKGTMITPTGEIKLGMEEGSFKPYQLLFGALGSCFYHTFLTIVEKKRLAFSKASLEISGNKRETVPTTLEHCLMKLVVSGASNKEQIVKSAYLAAQNCSIHETISKVATIELVIENID